MEAGRGGARAAAAWATHGLAGTVRGHTRRLGVAHGRLQPCGTNTEGAASLGVTPAGHVREPRCTALASCVNVEHTLAGPRPRCACTSGKEAAQHGRHPWCHGMACHGMACPLWRRAEWGGRGRAALSLGRRSPLGGPCCSHHAMWLSIASRALSLPTLWRTGPASVPGAAGQVAGTASGLMP